MDYLLWTLGSSIQLIQLGCPIDRRVAAIKSTELTWPLQVKSFQFQVAAGIFHSSRRQILG